MARKPAPPPTSAPPPPQPDLHARLRDVQAELDGALLSGSDTSAIRQRFAALQREANVEASVNTVRQVEADRIEQAGISERARAIAAEAAGRVAVALEDLMPPPPPWSLAN